METALQGIRLLDLTRYVAGPYAAGILAELGAEVIKIEPSGFDPETRPERALKPIPQCGLSELAHLALDRNKKSLTLDMRNKLGRAIFYDLVKVSDVVIDNFRPGIIEKMKVDYETLSQINPRIISCSISSFGSKGPMKDDPAYDIVLQAFAGGLTLSGEPTDPPVPIGVPICDMAGGAFASLGVVSALVERSRTGKGQRVETSLLASFLALLTFNGAESAMYGKPPERKRLAAGSPSSPYGVFNTKDGWIAVAAHRSYEDFCKALGRDDLRDDPRFNTLIMRIKNKHLLNGIVQDIMMSKTAEEWDKLFRQRGIPCSLVNTLDKTLKHPQTVEQEVVVDYPYALGGILKSIRIPLKMGATPRETRKAQSSPPVVGEHTDQLLKDLLGYSPERIAQLRRDKLV